MSIKRSREVTRRRPSDGGSSDSKKAVERVYEWEADVVPHLAEAALAYGAAHCYAKEALIQHSVFGKGLVTKVEGTKIEVLFEAGPKKLVHNPKGSEAPKAGDAPAAPAAQPAPAPAQAEAQAAAPAEPKVETAPPPRDPSATTT